MVTLTEICFMITLVRGFGLRSRLRRPNPSNAAGFPVNVDGESSIWSVCSKTCGAGIKIRSVIRNDGTNTRSNYEIQTCNERPCPSRSSPGAWLLFRKNIVVCGSVVSWPHSHTWSYTFFSEWQMVHMELMFSNLWSCRSKIPILQQPSSFEWWPSLSPSRWRTFELRDTGLQRETLSFRYLIVVSKECCCGFVVSFRGHTHTHTSCVFQWTVNGPHGAYARQLAVVPEWDSVIVTTLLLWMAG